MSGAKDKVAASWRLVPVFNDSYGVVVAFGQPEAISAVLAEWHGQDLSSLARVEASVGGRLGACFFARCPDGSMCPPVIAMPRRPTTPEAWGTLAHEACHAVEDIFKFIGQPLGDEVFAHAVGAVVRMGGGKWE